MKIERVLVLDETDANTLFFEMLFKDFGIQELYTTTTGADGLELVEKHHIQLIVASWEMRGMPGTVFIQKARKKRSRKHLPFVLYSKRMNEEEVQLTKELGFPNILQMPFDKEAARTMIKSIMDKELNMDSREVQLRKIDDYLWKAKPMEALKIMNQALLESPEYRLRALLLRGEIWLQLNKLDKAIEDLDVVLGEEPDNTGALYLRAKIASKKGDHEEAIELLKNMSEKSPKNLTTLVKLGGAYVSADRHDEAKEVLSRVTAADDDNQDAKDQMATMAFKDGDMSLAYQLVAETENGNEMASTFNNMAIAYVGKEEFEKGIETYNNAIKLLADKARLYLLHYNLGLALRKKGQLSDSLVQLAESYISEPTYEKAYAAIARTFKEIKEKNIPYDKDLVKRIKQVRAENKVENDKAS